MGALCEEGMSYAVRAIFEQDAELVKKAGDTEKEIDQMERDIENMCMRLLLQQQPVARDLRMISSALRMISDMERIGDQAADIAEIVKYIDAKEIPQPEQSEKHGRLCSIHGNRQRRCVCKSRCGAGTQSYFR